MAVRLGSNKWNYGETEVKSADLNDTFDEVRIRKTTYTDTTEHVFTTNGTTQTFKGSIATVDLSSLGLTQDDLIVSIDMSFDSYISPKDGNDWLRVVLYSGKASPGANDVTTRIAQTATLGYSTYTTYSLTRIKPFLLMKAPRSSLEMSSYTLTANDVSGSVQNVFMLNMNGTDKAYVDIVYYDYVGSQSTFYVKNLTIDFWYAKMKNY